MTPVRGFAPIADGRARGLILGSMPGRASLRVGQYYAHPRNAFWRVLGELVGAHPALPYDARVRALRSARLALWDVLAACTRGTSLDSDIEPDSVVVNDFVGFFAEHPKVTRVYFNGTMAEQSYRRRVLPGLPRVALTYRRLPSTSPANASWSYARKLAAWRAIVRENDHVTG
ncbi:MAG: DNA-deoxyinosine glycosylase [Candidatus Omnitrophica bacterium]|nr:DNA-deoxyinosine glycosylase [Candidatus Omnitrophota bacterium]